MPEEQVVPNLMARYQVIERDWRALNAHGDLLNTLLSRPIDVEHKIIICVSFGTGGLRKSEAFSDDKKNGIKEDAGQKVALYHIAIFKSIVDGIVDFDFLEALNITIKDVNSGLQFVNTRSLVYLPDAENRSAIEVKERNHNTYLSTGTLDTVTGRGEMDWSGFTSELQHGGVKGSEAAVRFNDECRTSRDWQEPTHFASSELKRHEPAYKSPMLVIRKDSVLKEKRDLGNPVGMLASALSN